MKKLINIFFLILLNYLLACSELKKGLGLEKEVPDEFLIRKSKSIVEPPDFDLLPPDTNKNKETIGLTSKKGDIKNIINETLKLDKIKQDNSIDKDSSEIETSILKKIK